MGVCKALDTQAVAGVQLILQELSTGITQCGDLKKTGGLKKKLDVLCGNFGTAGVNIGEEGVHCLGQDAIDLHEHFAALTVIIAEHCSEIGRTCREHSPVAGKLTSLYTDDHISEQAAVTKLIKHLQDAF